MQVAIACRHGNIRDEVRESITQKAQKLLTYFERVTSIRVTVDFGNERIKDRIQVEILVDAEHRQDFVSRDRGEDVPATFDRALHKMEQQIRRYKEKLQDHRRDRPLPDALETLQGNGSPEGEPDGPDLAESDDE